MQKLNSEFTQSTRTLTVRQHTQRRNSVYIELSGKNDRGMVTSSKLNATKDDLIKFALDLLQEYAPEMIVEED